MQTSQENFTTIVYAKFGARGGAKQSALWANGKGDVLLIELAISFLIGRKRLVNFRNQRL